MGYDLTGQLAVVTGGATGIGYELAKEFSARGFDVLICGDDDNIDAAARYLGRNVMSLRADVSSFEGVEALYGAIKQLERHVDAIAVNAGAAHKSGFGDSELNDDLRLVHLNVTSSVHLVKRVAADMVARGAGRILLTMSVAAPVRGPFNALYHASKAFICSFADGIGGELDGTGVTVTALVPGPSENELVARTAVHDAAELGQAEDENPRELARQAIDAMMVGETHVVAGSFKNRMQLFWSRLMPPARHGA